MKITRQMKQNGFYISPNGKIHKWTPYNFTGVHKKLHPNGQLWFESFYKNGKQHGRTSYWDEDGQLRYECFYKNGKLYGSCKAWCEDGQLRYECFYKNGKYIK